jgi:hypothetical protein
MNSTRTYSPEYLAEYGGCKILDAAILMAVLEPIYTGLLIISRHRLKTAFS